LFGKWKTFSAYLLMKMIISGVEVDGVGGKITGGKKETRTFLSKLNLKSFPFGDF
jgi:hypothetical protein